MDLGIDHSEFAREAHGGLVDLAPRTPDWASLRARMAANYEARSALARAAGRGAHRPAEGSQGSFDLELAQILRGPSKGLSAVNQKVSAHCKAASSIDDAAAAMKNGGEGQQ